MGGKTRRPPHPLYNLELYEETTVMTKKDFAAMAAHIAAIEDLQLRFAMATQTADAFAKANPRFDKAKYFQACACGFLT